MTLKLSAFLLILVCLPLNFALADSYVVPDGSTLPEDLPAPTATASTVEPPTTTGGNVDYDPKASTPPCDNSTCITAQTIFNAKHGYVQDSDVKTYIELINAPGEGGTECQQPTKTGATVFYFERGEDGTKTSSPYDDAFCINQGCVYFGAEGEERCE